MTQYNSFSVSQGDFHTTIHGIGVAGSISKTNVAHTSSKSPSLKKKSAKLNKGKRFLRVLFPQSESVSWESLAPLFILTKVDKS